MPWSRKKSCARCRVSKLRCNQATPTCSRCSERHLQCVYDGRDGDRVAPYPYYSRVASPPDSSLRTPSESSVLPTFGIDVSDGSVNGQSTGLQLDETLPDFNQELHLNWTATDVLGDFPESSTVSNHKTLQEFNTSRDQWSLQNPPDEPSTDRTLSLVTAGIEQATDKRALMRRRKHKICPLTSVILGQITSYPKMMIEGESLPPFIHPPCYIDEELAQDCAESGRHRCLNKDLSVCAGLVHMFYDRTAKSAAFAWKSIYVEGERLHSEYDKFSTQERLSALQSITVFLLLQAEDSESAASNGAGVLLATLTELVLDLTNSHDWRLDMPAWQTDRREWVFRESLRRIVVLLNIIDLLLEGIITSPTAPCHDYQAVPLPSSRDLWSARTNRGWRLAYSRYHASRKSNKVLTVGDLLESDNGGSITNSRNNDRNNEVKPDVMKWCEGLDAMGSLIWMAMPFERYRCSDTTQETW